MVHVGCGAREPEVIPDLPASLYQLFQGGRRRGLPGRASLPGLGLTSQLACTGRGRVARAPGRCRHRSLVGSSEGHLERLRWNWSNQRWFREGIPAEAHKKQSSTGWSATSPRGSGVTELDQQPEVLAVGTAASDLAVGIEVKHLTVRKGDPPSGWRHRTKRAVI